VTNAQINAQAASILAEIADKPATAQTAGQLRDQLVTSIGVDVQSIGVSIDNGAYVVNITHTDGQGFMVSATVNF
jgi:hypothetical protein